MLSCLNGISEYAPGEGILGNCGTQWEEMGGAEAEFKCKLVKLGAERTFHWEGSPGVSHTGLTKWEIPKGMLPAESQAGISWLCHTQIKTSCSFFLCKASL